MFTVLFPSTFVSTRLYNSCNPAICHTLLQLGQRIRLSASKMASNPAVATSTSANLEPHIIPEDLHSFEQHLYASHRILILCGAGLSASSGLPTFRGAGGYWRDNQAQALASPEAFAQDPSLVWQFYSYRRHMAFKAYPNRAHLALVELAKRRPESLTITQNVDGMSVIS